MLGAARSAAIRKEVRQARRLRSRRTRRWTSVGAGSDTASRCWATSATTPGRGGAAPSRNGAAAPWLLQRLRQLSHGREKGSGIGWALGERAPLARLPTVGAVPADTAVGLRWLVRDARARWLCAARSVSRRAGEKLVGGRVRASLVGLGRFQDVAGCSDRARDAHASPRACRGC